MKTFVTFGQNHYHDIYGIVYDKDCVAVITSSSAAEGREIAFATFGRKFCFEYPEYAWDEANMSFYPRGYVEVY
jgi:hypothetical protein